MERIKIKMLCGNLPPLFFFSLKTTPWDVFSLQLLPQFFFFFLDRVPQKVLSRRDESVVN